MIKKMIPVECWTRIVGYFRPVKAWNKGKQEEFKDRRAMPVKDVILKIKGN